MHGDAPARGFYTSRYREEANEMLTAICRSLARFWYGPSGTPGSTTIFLDEADEEDRAWMEEANRVTEEIYWFRRRDEEDDERNRDNEYPL